MNDDEAKAEEVYNKSLNDSYWGEAADKYPESNSNDAQTESSVSYILSGMRTKYPEYDWASIEGEVKDKIQSSLT